MSYHVVSPYPDEELGSIVTRARLQAGLSAGRFPRWYFGAPSGMHLREFRNLVLPMAGVTGVSPRELLRKHTLVPYGVAALELAESRRMFNELAHGNVPDESAVLGKVGRHWCEVCVRHDVATYGEAYWHRSHLLPGVATCHLHGTPLMHAPERLPFATINRAVEYWNRGPMPNELTGSPIHLAIPPKLQHQISELSARTLRERKRLPEIDLPIDTLCSVFGSVVLRQVGCFTKHPWKFPYATARILSIVAQRHLARMAGATQLELFS